jgi:acyl-CoA synthetase (NDP forming)
VLGLEDGVAVRAAAHDLLDRDGIERLLVAEQIGGGVEMLVGVTQDPLLGPVILVGAGGTAAEALSDVSRSVLPLTRSRADRMVAGLRVARVLDGWRGQPKVDTASLVDVLLRLAELAMSEPLIELDVNPLLVRADGVVGLDALVRLGGDDSS